MSKAPAFQFYAQDFLVGCAEMLPEEVGAYIRLLCYQWTKGGIPDNIRQAKQLTGLHDEQSLHVVLAKFVRCDDGMLRNKRMEDTRKSQDEYRERQRQIALNGWEKRKGSQSQSDANPMPSHKKNDGLAMPQAMPNECQNDALHLLSSTSTLTPTSTPPSENSLPQKAAVSKRAKQVSIPSIDEFLNYARTIPQLQNNFAQWEFTLTTKYETWKDNGWKDGHGKEIKTWKNKLRSTLPYLKPMQNGTTTNTGRRNIDERLADAETRGGAVPRFTDFDDVRNRGDESGGYADVIE